MSLELKDLFLIQDGRTSKSILSINDSHVVVTLSKDKSSSTYKRDDLIDIEFTETAHQWKVSLHFPNNSIRFVGMSTENMKDLKKFAGQVSIPVTDRAANLTGRSWGMVEVMNGLATLSLDNKTTFDYPLNQISQVIAQTKYELEVQLKTNPAVKEDVHELTAVRYYCPENELTGDNPSDELNQQFKENASFLQESNDEIICRFDDLQLEYPRGKYNFALSEKSFNISTKKFSYNINWSDVKRLYFVDQDEDTKLLLVGLEPGLKQGNKTYIFLTIQLPIGPPVPLHLNASPEDFQNKWKGNLQQTMTDTMQTLVPHVLSSFCDCKIFGADKTFTPPNNMQYVPAYHKSIEGMLYMLKRGILFVKNPSMLIRYDDVKEVQFTNLDDGNGALESRTFNLIIELKNVKTKLEFIAIDNRYFDSLFQYLEKMNVQMKDMGMLKGTVGKLVTSGSAKSMKDRQEDKLARQQLKKLQEAGDDTDSDDEDFDMDDDDDSTDDWDSDMSDDDSSSRKKKSSKKDKKEKKDKKSKKDKKDKKEKKDKKRERGEDGSDDDSSSKSRKKQKTKDDPDAQHEVQLGQ